MPDLTHFYLFEMGTFFLSRISLMIRAVVFPTPGIVFKEFSIWRSRRFVWAIDHAAYP